MEPLRLNRFLAAAGVASRRKCDDLIRRGRITVNDVAVTELGTRVDPAADVVAVDGEPVRLPTQTWTLVLNKPREVLVAAVDGRGRKTVTDLLVDAPGRVFPVGRLDYRSEGLLIFTNDGDLAYRLAHPSFKVDKLYRIEVDGRVSPATLEALRAGVVLEDGRTLPAQIVIVENRRGRTVLEIELREGRKRQIRRMFGLFGHEVRRLKRTRFGSLELGDLPVGKWRELLAAEVEALRGAVGFEPDDESPGGEAGGAPA